MVTLTAVRRATISFGMLIAILPGLAHSQTKSATPSANPANNEQEELRREIRELRQGQEAIQKELQEIKRLLLAKGPARAEKISISARPFRGNQNARVVLVEFSDYQCPFCGRFYRETLPQVDKEYIQPGKIKYVFKNLPLEDLHSSAFGAALAVECAASQGKFWDLHSRLFANQNALAPSDLAAQAKAIGLDMGQFNGCLESKTTAASVRAGLEEAASLGIQATPTFVIGLVDAKNPDDSNIKIVSMISGAHPFPVFRAAIDKALATQ